MYRYYVSFSHQAPQGFGIAALDVTAENLITSIDELTTVHHQLTQRGYRAVTILAFSLYANPTTKPAPAPRPQNTPMPQNNPTPRNIPTPQQPRRRPSPRPGRHS